MAKTNNLTDFLTDLANGIRKAETGSESGTKINPQNFRSRVEGLVATVTNDATASAGDMLASKTAYVKGKKITGTIATKTSSNVTVSGATVSVPAGYYASAVSKSVTTTTTAKPTIMVGVDGVITATAYYNQGYISASENTTQTYQLDVKTSSDLTASGATVTVPAGYYTKSASKSVTTATRATTTLTSAASNGNLVFTAGNNQSTGYVTGSNSTATKTVSLTASGATVTASDGTNSISKSVATAARANTTLTSAVSNGNLVFTASNNQSTGYVTGSNKTATKTVSLSISGTTITASDGTNSITKTFNTDQYYDEGYDEGYDDGYDDGYADGANSGTSTVTNLAGTSWVFKDTLNLTGLTDGTLTWTLTFKSATSSASSSGTYSSMVVKYMYNGSKYYYALYYGSFKVYDTLSGWVASKYKYVDVTGGTAATNATTISTFTTNALQRFDEYLEALGALCEWYTVIDSEDFYCVNILNKHPSYYLRCTVKYSAEASSYDLVIYPNSSYAWTTGAFAEQDESISVTNVRWTKSNS